MFVLSEKMQTDKFLFEEEELRTALAAVLHRNSPKWMRISRKILKNKEDAEDVLSEAVRRMLKRGPSFSSQEHMRMYMGRVVSNTAFEFYKRRKNERRRQAPILEDIIKKSTMEQTEYFRPDFIMEEEERYAEHEDRLIMLRRGLEELPAHQYEAIRLTVFGSSGRTQRDMESASGIPRNTLRYRYLQGLRALRKYMAREQKRIAP
jgi:RNA polymerase sigma factor (sigma-70 family)